MEQPRLSNSLIDVRGIPRELRDLPVGFAPDGQMVSLMDMLRWPDGTPFIDYPADIPRERLVEITIRRIEMQPEFSVGVIGREKVDQGRAIEEIRKDSPLGKTLVDIERYYIQYILDVARGAN